MIYSIVYLRVLAVLLIVNCHLAVFYPHAAMAFGGYLGNGLFYFISGYGLALAQDKNPLTPLNWYKKRLTKILIPFVFYIAVLHFGDWEKFIWAVDHNLIINSVDKLQYFFGVLWVLYLMFFPISKLSTRVLIIILTGFSMLIMGSFIIKIQSLPLPIPKNIPTTDLYFLCAGIICFGLGIIASRINFDSVVKRNSRISAVMSFFLIFGSIFLHYALYKIDTRLVFLNFYFNIMCVFGLYIFFCLPWTKILDKYKNVMFELASCSLAVYFVHFFMMDVVENLKITFPFNVIAIFVYSFIFSYPLTRMATYLADRALLMVGDK